jgi:hypothetical protein
MSDGQSLEQTVLDIQARNRVLSHAEREAEASRPPARTLPWLPLVTIPIVLGLWWWSLSGVDLRHMNDLGLASVLGPGFLAALVLLSASMTVSLVDDRPSEGALLAHVLVLILILYGSMSLLVSVPQGTAVYRHLGISEYVTSHGSVDRTIDAYFNWPGFFIMTSALTSVVGARSAMALARWGPLLFNLLFLVPLVLFFRAVCRGIAYTWLCIWLFFCCNWVGQDIFSPQAYGYLGYLAVLAVMVALFRTRKAGGTGTAAGTRRAAVFVAIVLAFVAITISHQLTPYALAVAVAAFALFRGTRLWALPLLMGVVTISWFAYAATPFFSQFLRQQSRNIGAVSENLNTGIGARIAGTPEHIFVVDTRVAITLALWGLVPVGIWIRRRRGLPSTPFVALAGSTIVLAGLQSYGGEIFLRTYLFSLPAVVLFVAAILIFPLTRLLRGFAISALSVGLLMLFVFARYGNAKLDYFSPQEVAAMQQLYHIAPPGSLFLAGSGNLPWRFEHYDGYGYATVDELTTWVHGSTNQRSVDRVAAEILQKMRPEHGNAYLIFMRSMEPWEEFVDLRRAGELARVERTALQLGAFRVIYRNEDATIYALRPERTASPRGLSRLSA